MEKSENSGRLFELDPWTSLPRVPYGTSSVRSYCFTVTSEGAAGVHRRGRSQPPGTLALAGSPFASSGRINGEPSLTPRVM
ncbi:hypothetical protein BAUCODRAFT_37489 [Baudoinia panamericana UAMH 10762]|uniref:Uncharacterized protein n=1 Tax=Baudoinia panamericana (strain UAMH 10762) TaxID=717646 RepID=M2LF05_BAUPA|nr:uncharacterized protein BAUCODRAFT_37489 [Baudoinia panamericana UAMH 10762]EMC92602.1 hypothetical protein BAUCODRAFT_37489 [Baudoinia panamericana UAMH 10762]